CLLGGPPPVGGGLRRRSRWRSAARAEDDRPDLRSAKRRDRPRAGHPAQDRRRLWPALAGGAALRPGRPGVFRLRRGRLAGDRRRGSPPDHRLRDEQDGAVPDRRAHRGGAGRAGVPDREGLGHAPRTAPFGPFLHELSAADQRHACSPNRSSRYASSGPPRPSYASCAMSSANGSVYRAIRRVPASTGSKPTSRIKPAATPLPLSSSPQYTRLGRRALRLASYTPKSTSLGTV